MKLLHEIPYTKRLLLRKDGIVKVERWSFGATGRKYNGQPATGHWKTAGYRSACGKHFAPTLSELTEKMNTNSVKS